MQGTVRLGESADGAADDAALRRCREGDISALGELVTRYQLTAIRRSLATN